MVALTLPEEVLDALGTVHQDTGWAIVQLVEGRLTDGARESRTRALAPLAELVHLPGGRALIVVQPRLFTGLRGVSTILLADGRAFLALDHQGGIADLELAILDLLEELPARSRERAQLIQVRNLVRTWRRGSGLVFRTKSIIVAEGAADTERRPLATLETAEGEPT